MTVRPASTLAGRSGHHFTFCFSANGDLDGTRRCGLRHHHDHQERRHWGHEKCRPAADRGRPVRPTVCKYVDAAEFPNSMNGKATLAAFHYFIDGVRTDATVQTEELALPPAAPVPTRATTRARPTTRLRAAATRSRSTAWPDRPVSERLDQQRDALAPPPGQHQGRLVLAGQREPLAQLVGDDVDAALLDGQPADPALAQGGAQRASPGTAAPRAPGSRGRTACGTTRPTVT